MMKAEASEAEAEAAAVVMWYQLNTALCEHTGERWIRVECIRLLFGSLSEFLRFSFFWLRKFVV